jgi:hypothetical protein
MSMSKPLILQGLLFSCLGLFETSPFLSSFCCYLCCLTLENTATCPTPRVLVHEREGLKQPTRPTAHVQGTDGASAADEVLLNRVRYLPNQKTKTETQQKSAVLNSPKQDNNKANSQKLGNNKACSRSFRMSRCMASDACDSSRACSFLVLGCVKHQQQQQQLSPFGRVYIVICTV